MTEKGWTVTKIGLTVLAGLATVGVTAIGVKQDVEKDLPKLADNSSKIIDTVAKEVGES